MKPVAISSCLALAALSLFAADPQGATDLPRTLHTEKLLSSPRSIGVVDSPLVRAAKATNRLGKKPTQVITNETLVREGGHFTTTTQESQTQLPTARKASEPSWDQLAADARKNWANAAAAAEQAKKLEEQKRQHAGRQAATAEGDTPESIYSEPLPPSSITNVKPLTPEMMRPPQKPPQ